MLIIAGGGGIPGPQLVPRNYSPVCLSSFRLGSSDILNVIKVSAHRIGDNKVIEKLLYSIMTVSYTSRVHDNRLISLQVL